MALPVFSAGAAWYARNSRPVARLELEGRVLDRGSGDRRDWRGAVQVEAHLFRLLWVVGTFSGA